MHTPCAHKGISLAETVVYVGLFSFLSIILLLSLFQTVNIFYALRASRDINDSSVKVMERMTRDIRGASSIDMVNSIFNSTPGKLAFTTTSASGTSMTVEYIAVGNTIRLKENGVDQGSLLAGLSSVDALIFKNVATGTTAGVKIELHLRYRKGSETNVEHFYDTVLLRGSY